MARQFKDGDLIVGFRFEWHENLAPDRTGVNSLVIDQMASAGPIYYWNPDPANAMGFAVCRGCRKMSGGSGKGNRADAVRRWAHQHRCESGQRLDERPWIKRQDVE